jgi:TonB family protein
MCKRASGSLLHVSGTSYRKKYPSRGVPPLIKALLLFGFLFSFSTALNAQQPSDAANSLEQIQSRIERARALIAAHRLDTAASELESVRAATQDYAVHNITSIMLMSVYLEEGNYGRAEALLEENYQARSAQKDESLGTYFALAGQAVNGARTHLARYRSFGINTSDASLPAEAVSDLNRLQALLERMIAQAKEISNGRRAYDSLSLLEDVLGIRLSLAKDSEDQARWEAEYASAREVLASSQTQIASLGGLPMLPPKSPSANTAVVNSTKLASEAIASDKTAVSADKTSTSDPPATEPTSSTQPKVEPVEPAADPKENPPADQPATESTSSTQSTVELVQPAADSRENQPTDKPKTIDSGSLNARATKRVVPRYPALARQNGTTGVVRVYVLVDESGKVLEVSRSEGPFLLREAAEDAARHWSFSAVDSDGGPVRFSGYIDFNFTL